MVLALDDGMKDTPAQLILIRRIVLNDDQQAFKELYVEFFPSLCLFAGRFIDSCETCEDIVQETFFHLWKNRKKIEIKQSFRNFLVTSVKNHCIDHLRKINRFEHYLENPPLTASSDTPEDIFTISELEELLYSAISALPDKPRRAFELSRFHSMSYQQIAQEMDISPKTVEAYIGKALSLLRTQLKEYLPALILLFPNIFC